MNATSSEFSLPTKDLSPTGDDPKFRKLRIWPPLVLLALLWVGKLIPWIWKDGGSALFMLIFFAPLVATLGVVLWWLFASRAAWSERLLGLAGLVLIAAVSLLLADPTIRNFATIIMYVLPWGLTAFAGALILFHGLSPRWRTSAALLIAAVGFGGWNLAKFEGMWGDFHPTFTWRWTKSAEERYLATLANRADAPAEIPTLPVDQASLSAPEWPGFRGPHRDGVVPGLVLDADWNANPPQELWRRPMGPAWSSFAVAGDRLFTQEQRGEKEAIVCLDAETGADRWGYEYDSRFFEVLGGPGPRATPTLAEGRLFVLGAEGLLHCLDPWTGSVHWKRDVKAHAGGKTPMWGFASSPLVFNDVVIVHAGGEVGKSVVLACDVQTGESRWSAPAGDHSYSSPQRAQVGARTVVLMHTNTGLHVIDPEQGKTLGDYDGPIEGYAVLQPLRINASDVLLGMGMDVGTRRIELSLDGDVVHSVERWTSRDMKPGYNDWVVHQGYVYGFDQDIFACIDLKSGKRQWKKGRYGAGQVLLLPEQDQLLVISEKGELVLLRATPEKLDELARSKAIEGKTWNHPVLVGNRLYVRNAEEAACFAMPMAVKGSSALSPFAPRKMRYFRGAKGDYAHVRGANGDSR